MKPRRTRPAKKPVAFRFAFEINRQSAGSEYLKAIGRPITERRQFWVRCKWPEVAVFYWKRDEADDAYSTIERLPAIEAGHLLTRFASFEDIARNVWRPEYPDLGGRDANEAGADLIDRIVKDPIAITSPDVAHAFIDLIETAWHGQSDALRKRAAQDLQRLIPRRPGGRKPLPPGLDVKNLRVIANYLAAKMAWRCRNELRKTRPVRQTANTPGRTYRQLLKALTDPRLERMADRDLVTLINCPSAFADAFVANTLGQSVRTLKTLAPLPPRSTHSISFDPTPT